MEKGDPLQRAHTREALARGRRAEARVEGGTSTGTLGKETHRTRHAHLGLVGSCSPIIPHPAQKCGSLAGVMSADGNISNSPGHMGGLDSFAPLALHMAE